MFYIKIQIKGHKTLIYFFSLKYIQILTIQKKSFIIYIVFLMVVNALLFVLFNLYFYYYIINYTVINVTIERWYFLILASF